MTPRQEELLNIICAGVHAARLAAEELAGSIDVKANISVACDLDIVTMALKDIADEPTLGPASGIVAAIEDDLRAEKWSDGAWVP